MPVERGVRGSDFGAMEHDDRRQRLRALGPVERAAQDRTRMAKLDRRGDDDRRAGDVPRLHGAYPAGGEDGNGKPGGNACDPHERHDRVATEARAARSRL